MKAGPLLSASTERSASLAPPPPTVSAPTLALLSSVHAIPARNDAVSFDYFFRRYHRRVWTLLATYIADKNLAEDLTQETLVRAYLAGLHAEVEGRQWRWLAKVARNLATDVARRKRVRLELPAGGDEPEGVDDVEPYDALSAAWRRAGILEVLGSVPAKQARILIARHVEGQGYEQIAATESMSVEAVRSLLFRTRRILRRRYERLARVRGLSVLAPGVAHGWRSRVRSAQARFRDLVAIPRLEFLPAGVPAALSGAALGGMAIVGATIPSTGGTALDTTRTASPPDVIEVVSRSPMVDPLPASSTNRLPLAPRPASDGLDAHAETINQPPGVPRAPIPPANASTSGIEGAVETETVAPIEGAPAGGGAAVNSDDEGAGLRSHREASVDIDGDGEGDVRGEGSAGVDCRADQKRIVAGIACLVPETSSDMLSL